MLYTQILLIMGNNVQVVDGDLETPFNIHSLTARGISYHPLTGHDEQDRKQP